MILIHNSNDAKCLDEIMRSREGKGERGGFDLTHL